MATYQRDHRFAKPRPVHALTDGALAGVASVLSVGAARRLDEEMAALVTKHGYTQVEAWVGEVIPRNARNLERDALALGYRAQSLVRDAACTVEGYHAEARVGFRAMWLRGAAFGFSWHTPWRYEVVEDRREVRVNQKTHTGLSGYRSAGMGMTRLALVGTPDGLPVTYAELLRRMRAVAGGVSS